jgi:hypothetical protein
VDTRVCKVALAATHYIEFCVSEAEIGLGGVDVHETGPLVDQALLSI